MFAALAPAAGQSPSWYGNRDGQYRYRDDVSRYRDNGYRQDRYGPSESSRRYAYRPDYSRPYGQPSHSARADLQPIHMYVNSQTGETLLSKGPEQEHGDTLAYDYVPQGVRFYLLTRPEANMVPLYRFNVPGMGHVYGSKPDFGYRLGGYMEGILGYMYAQSGPNTIALQGWYDYRTGGHHYSTRSDLSDQYDYMGPVGYVIRG
jgi:hypothetical protein